MVLPLKSYQNRHEGTTTLTVMSPSTTQSVRVYCVGSAQSRMHCSAVFSRLSPESQQFKFFLLVLFFVSQCALHYIFFIFYQREHLCKCAGLHHQQKHRVCFLQLQHTRLLNVYYNCSIICRQTHSSSLWSQTTKSYLNPKIPIQTQLLFWTSLK